VRDLLLLRQPGQDRLAEGGGVGADAAARAPDHAVALQACIDAGQVDHLAPVQHAERAGVRDARHQFAQQGLRVRREVAGGEGREAELQALQGEAKSAVVRHGPQVTEADQGVDQAEGGAAVEPGAGRDLGGGQLGGVPAEGLEHRKGLGDGLDLVLRVVRSLLLALGRCRPAAREIVHHRLPWRFRWPSRPHRGVRRPLIGMRTLVRICCGRRNRIGAQGQAL
jgi:hypothetical protein